MNAAMASEITRSRIHARSNELLRWLRGAFTGVLLWSAAPRFSSEVGCSAIALIVFN
jgi:hypothetical protein